MTTDQTTTTTGVDPATGHPLPGARVRVTAARTDSTSTEFREWITGREGTYVRHDTSTTMPSTHLVRFPERRGGGEPVDLWVAGVEVLAPPVGRGDRVRVTHVRHNADPEFAAHAVGATGRLLAINTGVPETYVVELDTPYAGGQVWHVVGVEHHHAPVPEHTADQTADQTGRPVIFSDGIEADPDHPGRALLGKRVHIVATRKDGAGDAGTRRNGMHGIVTAVDTNDDLLAFQVRIDAGQGPTATAPWDAGPWWVYAVTLEGSPTSEPIPDGAAGEDTGGGKDADEKQTAAREQYTALAKAAITLARTEDWCTEFEQVMSRAGFPEVRCNRERTYQLRIRGEYTLGVGHLAAAIAEYEGIDDDDSRPVPEVLDDAVVEVEFGVTWVSDTDPNDLDERLLADLLIRDGYGQFDTSPLELIDADDQGEPEHPNDLFEPRPGDGSWVERLEAFTTLLHHEAASRGWGHHLADVYDAAGMDLPRAEKLDVEVTARKSIYPYAQDGYGRAMAADPLGPDYLTVHKRVSFQIDNPAPTDVTECRCRERDETGGDGKARLVEPMKSAVITGARETLRTLMPEDHAGWVANHEDVQITCLYCR